MYNEKTGAVQFEIEGPSLDDCKRRLYAKHGTNYQIINQKTILKGGFLGFGQHEVIQLQYIVNQPNQSMSFQKNQTVNSNDDFQRARDELLKKTDSSITNTIQMAQIAKKLDKISEEFSEKLESISQTSSEKEKPATIKKIEELLESNEFTISYINKISEKIRNEFSLEELDDFNKIKNAVVDWIGEGIKIAKPVTFRPPHVIIIVGPTGVGKTTTVAKLASNIILDAKNKNEKRPEVMMITIDKLRVGAEVQLKRYGEILGSKVEVAERTDDLKTIFDENRAKLDYLLIDTSGYSPNDFENIGKMRSILEVPELHPDVFLAFSAGTKAKDLERILKTYESFNYQSVIITKCDETSSFGNVLSVLSEKQTPISWITDGQKVPRFIEKASAVYFLTRLSDFEIDRSHIDEKFNQEDTKKFLN